MNMRVFYKSLLSLLGFFSVQMKAETEVNVASWGTAVQSTTYGIFANWNAQIAVDGSSSYCSRTDTESDPWWKLDLKKTYTVNRVTITNRICPTVNCEIWINGAVIRIGNDSSVLGNPECATVSSIPAGKTNSFSCPGMKGRYVTVNIPGNSKILTFCEVGVYVNYPDNLATGRTAIQSSTYGVWFAQRAIDFNPGFTNSWSACSSTDSENKPWWRVDLGYVYRVSTVVITNILLGCCPDRINGAEIRIGNSLENNGNNNPRCAVISSIPAGVSSTYTCNNMEGRYVNLFIPEDSRTLTLCEVEVYGEGPVSQEDSCEDENYEFTVL
ncbi:uncharacterized protein LOC113070322 [Carassius auratus]|uniref:Uncharacterized protein LOC113070322 n=1 Tax=Carassius auratus TaxID=7957 RepID=A0A6P6MTE6_CARAU|nr:uncharacterized protein LOC113070322 [Carassius auratus]